MLRVQLAPVTIVAVLGPGHAEVVWVPQRLNVATAVELTTSN